MPSGSEFVGFDIELEVLLQAIYRKYHYDFRGYSAASMRRRLATAMQQFHCDTISQLQNQILDDPAKFSEILDYLTVQVSDVFRDPSFYLSLRTHVVPVLHTYPSLKFWIAGCATGEEVYSFAILLREEGLLDRSMIYATDISGKALQKAEAGVYAIDRMAGFTVNYQQAGGLASLSDYYAAAYGNAVFDKSLKKNVVFSDHSLATDSVFAEVQLVSCRNVLIYFDRELQERAFGLFADSLCRKGFLCMGKHETPQFSAHARQFSDFSQKDRIFQKRGVA